MSLPVWFLVILTAPLLAEPAAQLTADRTAAIDTLVRDKMLASGIPGLSIAVAVNDQLAYAKGFGLADVENWVPATADTVYRTASIAKSFTAVAVMQLAEQKKIDLDRHVDEFYTEFPRKKWPITARLLLAHMAGVRHYARPFESLNTRHYFDVPSALRVFSADPLLFEPGTEFRYSSFGFNLLGALVEQASGQEFTAYLERSVCQPAGLLTTRADDHFAIIPHRSRGYVRPDNLDEDKLPNAVVRAMKAGSLYNAALHDTSVKIPGGGLVSTAPDLIRFATAVNRGKLVSNDACKLMWEPQHTTSGGESEYGLGWRVFEHRKRTIVGHGGGQAGVSTMFMLCPEKHAAVAVMCNLQNAKLQTLCQQLLDEAMRKPAGTR